MLANALGGNCKSAGTESKNMQIKCYATELTAMVTRCLDKTNSVNKITASHGLVMTLMMKSVASNSISAETTIRVYKASEI